MLERAGVLVLIAVVAAVTVVNIGAAADGLAPGDVLDRSTWEKAEGLLPPEILKHYREGEYANPIADWPEGRYNIPPDFKAGTDANADRFTVSAEGTIVEKATGKQPAWVLGQPFPRIDPVDENAAVKVLWNYFYQFWYFGNLHAESQVNWISTTALERRSDQDVRFFYYDGVPEAERPPNPQNFLTQSLIVVKSPADLQGTAALTWRYREAARRDSSWTYVPALRRVRAVSPANRSDGFLGSDMSQDDGPFFDGKPEDFEWKLKGETEEYKLAEDLNLKGVSVSVWVDQVGAWDAVWPARKFLGYMDPARKGVAWAPAEGAVLAKRKMWVIEGTPKDRYYLFGKVELHIDKVTYQGAWNRKFSWKGEPLGIMQTMSWDPLPFTRPDGKVDFGQGSNQAYQCAENLKLTRATVAGIKSSPTAGFYGRVKFNPALFDIDALSRYGK